jgi:hypothetical protein
MALPVVLLCVAVASVVVEAHAANMTVPGGSMGLANNGAAAAQFEPSACTGTVSRIVVVPAGGGLLTVSTANNLIVGTTGNDNVQVTTGYQCFVGGGPASANRDKFTGRAGAGDQCVIAASDPSGNIKNCSLVQRSP